MIRKTLHATIGMSILAVTVAACGMELTDREIAQINGEYSPLISALIPACISTGLGQKADYANLKALGYQQRDAILRSGDYFYSTDGNVLFGSKTGINFVPGEGCTVNVPADDAKAFHEIGSIWRRALENSGYPDSSDAVSEYSFTVDGTDFYFLGTKRLSSSPGTGVPIYQTEITYLLKRKR
ncbi:hypothetical protein [Paracoccus alkanivorans]|uniref:Uncharacterized protein n=1 Tax=Paracoccus alkanivorans TaxID=2116655 RepID=A0A3M0LXB9_9RHOB|nr:hypothetical protein [Paracoccus alkanivorans]RMC29673.1 hypothetical protein C9E81_22440 [Paracoccus alkanivorans]